MIEYYLPQAVVLIICDLTQSEGEYYPSLYSWGRTHAFTQTLLDERLLVILNFFGRICAFPNFVQRYHSLGWHLLKTDWNPDRVTISTTTGIRRHLRRNALTFRILCLTSTRNWF